MLLLDVLLDIYYLFNSPFYSKTLCLLGFVFWSLPFILTSSIFCICNQATYPYRCAIFALINGQHLRTNRHPSMRKESLGVTFAFTWLFYVIVEDFPQLIIQTVNNILIGNTLTVAAVAAPVSGYVNALQSVT